MDGIKLHFKTISDSLNTIYMNDCKVEFLESEIEIHGTNEAPKHDFQHSHRCTGKETLSHRDGI